MVDFPFFAFAAAGGARPVFFDFEGTALGDCFAEADGAAAAGDARGDARLAETGALDTPPLTADLGVLGVLAGEALAAAGDLALAAVGDNTLPGVAFVAALADFAADFPFVLTPRDLSAAILPNSKRLPHWQAPSLSGKKRPKIISCARLTCNKLASSAMSRF